MSTDKNEALRAEVAALTDMRDRAWRQAEHHARANEDSAAARCRTQFNALGKAIASLSAPPSGTAGEAVAPADLDELLDYAEVAPHAGHCRVWQYGADEDRCDCAASEIRALAKKVRDALTATPPSASSTAGDVADKWLARAEQEEDFDRMVSAFRREAERLDLRVRHGQEFRPVVQRHIEEILRPALAARRHASQPSASSSAAAGAVDEVQFSERTRFWLIENPDDADSPRTELEFGMHVADTNVCEVMFHRLTAQGEGRDA